MLIEQTKEVAAVERKITIALAKLLFEAKERQVEYNKQVYAETFISGGNQGEVVGLKRAEEAVKAAFLAARTI